mgnify:CR=1 FL=1
MVCGDCGEVEIAFVDDGAVLRCDCGGEMHTSHGSAAAEESV